MLVKPGRLSNNNINVISNNFQANKIGGTTATLHSLGGLVNDNLIKKPPLAPKFDKP